MEYRLTWIVGRFAGNLDVYRQAFHDAAGEYNEAAAMARGELLSTISFTFVGPGQRAAADDNVRMCHYFVLVAEDSWDAPPASFRAEYKLALACQSDPKLPLREAVAMFRKPSDEDEADERLTKFRAALDPGVRQFDFSDVAEFKAQVAELFAAWMESAE